MKSLIYIAGCIPTEGEKAAIAERNGIGLRNAALFQSPESGVSGVFVFDGMDAVVKAYARKGITAINLSSAQKEEGGSRPPDVDTEPTDSEPKSEPETKPARSRDKP